MDSMNFVVHLKTEKTDLNARFPEYFPAYSLSTGKYYCTVFPSLLYSPSRRGTYCESTLLDSSMVRGCSILNPILLTHVELTQVGSSPLSTILEESRTQENIPEIVHYITNHRRIMCTILTLFELDSTRVHIELQYALLINRYSPFRK